MEENEYSAKKEASGVLPILAHKAEIMDAMRRNQVAIVRGDTGSGKTTQLPKMALELGLARDGLLVACTQPRRLAAVAVAERVAAEMKSAVGGVVGYQHRYARATSPSTRIKFMTDGVLLAETRSDPLLKRYGAIIVDEAHERSLNIDFLLGILKRILPRRPDLKVVVSSATMDTEKFSRFFSGAPAITVPGRLHPVETIYAPPPDGEDADLPRDVSTAVRALPPGGDVLVFLPGERDIRETASRMAKSPFHKDDDVIPLLASLPAGEQRRAFLPSPKRRVILSTNVAETSVTIPGVRAVVDSGLARISRYVHRTQVQRLQIEPVSQASARQRAGRCGRTGPGICVRLYSEADFLSRDEYTPPEILRCSLAGVILTMLDLRMGSIESFPFIDPPKPAMIRSGLRELVELGAVCHDPASGEIALTPAGRSLARIPVEPRLARIMLEASRLATLPSAIPLVAAMSCDDPRRRPAEERERADQAHAPFRDPSSDFLGTLKLWRWWREQSATLSQSALRRLAQKTFLSFPKMREWCELARQLADLAKRLKLDAASDNGGPDALHRALLAGLLSRIGRLDTETGEYRGARSIRFELHPSSALAKAAKRGKGRPDWIVAGELVDTSRLFARSAAPIDPAWLEDAAGPLMKRSWHSPEWDGANGFMRVFERATLYGLVVFDGRRRDMSRFAPEEARRLFIFHALVEGDVENPPAELAANLGTVAKMREAAERARDKSLFPEDRLAAFFDRVLPPSVASLPALRKWLGRASRQERAAFALDPREWLEQAQKTGSRFPSAIKAGGATLQLSYAHRPDDPETDGITCTVRRRDADVLRLWRHDWLVPGALPGKVAWMLGALPSAERRLVAPVDETAQLILPLLDRADGDLAAAVRNAVRRRLGIRLKPGSFDETKAPPHLRVRFRILDDEGKNVLALSRDLEKALAESGACGGAGRADAAAAARTPVKHVRWDFGPVDPSEGASRGGVNVASHRALFDEGDGVSIRLFPDAASAALSHGRGVARLILLALPKSATRAADFKNLPFPSARILKSTGCSPEALASDVSFAAVSGAAVSGLPAVASAEGLESRIREKTGEIAAAACALSKLAPEILSAAAETESMAAREKTPGAAARDTEEQIAWMLFKGFVRIVPPDVLARYPKYFKAAKIRLERAAVSPSSDAAKRERFLPYWEQYKSFAADSAAMRKADRAALSEYRWLLEEYRVSVFAPEVGTAKKASPERLSALWLAATGMAR